MNRGLPPMPTLKKQSEETVFKSQDGEQVDVECSRQILESIYYKYVHITKENHDK